MYKLCKIDSSSIGRARHHLERDANVRRPLQTDAALPTGAPLNVSDVGDIVLANGFARKANSTPSAHLPTLCTELRCD